MWGWWTRPLGPGPDQPPWADAVGSIDPAAAEVVLLGNSGLRHAVDVEALSTALSAPAVSLAVDGSALPSWLVALRRAVVDPGGNPRLVVLAASPRPILSEERQGLGHRRRLRAWLTPADDDVRGVLGTGSDRDPDGLRTAIVQAIAGLGVAIGAPDAGDQPFLDAPDEAIGSGQPDPHTDIADTLLPALWREVRALDAQLVVALLPVSSTRAAGADPAEARVALRAWAQEHGVGWIDLRSLATPEAFRDPVHLSAAGRATVTEALAARLLPALGGAPIPGPGSVHTIAVQRQGDPAIPAWSPDPSRPGDGLVSTHPAWAVAPMSLRARAIPLRTPLSVRRDDTPLPWSDRPDDPGVWALDRAVVSGTTAPQVDVVLDDLPAAGLFLPPGTTTTLSGLGRRRVTLDLASLGGPPRASLAESTEPAQITGHRMRLVGVARDTLTLRIPEDAAWHVLLHAGDRDGPLLGDPVAARPRTVDLHAGRIRHGPGEDRRPAWRPARPGNTGEIALRDPTLVQILATAKDHHVPRSCLPVLVRTDTVGPAPLGPHADAVPWMPMHGGLRAGPIAGADPQWALTPDLESTVCRGGHWIDPRRVLQAGVATANALLGGVAHLEVLAHATEPGAPLTLLVRQDDTVVARVPIPDGVPTDVPIDAAPGELKVFLRPPDDGRWWWVPTLTLHERTP